MDEPSSFEVGDWIAGKYQIERVLGRGGMGVVVAARHVELDELRAIKILHREHCTERAYVDRFLREAVAMARVSGEHVVQVHDTGRLDDGVPYIVMEHLEGADLAQVLAARGPLPIGEAALYVLEACDALAGAHARGIFHRDLKPSNLFVASRGDGSPCLKVLDFGLAKVAAAGDSQARFTGPHERMGSPAYVAPEQVLALRDADARADVWSLGVILFELLTGQLPFHGESLADTLTLVLTAPPKPLRLLRRDVPPRLAAVVLGCLEKDPAGRIQTVVELRSALAPYGPLGVRFPRKDPWLAATATLPAPPIVRTAKGSRVRRAHRRAAHRLTRPPRPGRLAGWTRRIRPAVRPRVNALTIALGSLACVVAALVIGRAALGPRRGAASVPEEGRGLCRPHRGAEAAASPVVRSPSP